MKTIAYETLGMGTDMLKHNLLFSASFRGSPLWVAGRTRAVLFVSFVFFRSLYTTTKFAKSTKKLKVSVRQANFWADRAIQFGIVPWLLGRFSSPNSQVEVRSVLWKLIGAEKSSLRARNWNVSSSEAEKLGIIKDAVSLFRERIERLTPSPQ